MTLRYTLLAVAALAALTVTPVSAQPTCPWGERGIDADADEDGLSDVCESELLRRFAPVLLASPVACNWDETGGRLEGGYLVGAEPVQGGVRLAYLPAYYFDCGWSGAKCLLRPRGGCDPHHGDSEAIFVDVTVSDAGTDWQAKRVFLSAHCFGRSDGRCRWFDAESLEWSGSHPIVWVAEGKNANYPSKRACDSGHWGFDTCDRDDRGFFFPVESSKQNIGSAARPFPFVVPEGDCIGSTDLIRPQDRTGTECPWSGASFGGWLGAEASATSYRRYLTEIAGFLR